MGSIETIERADGTRFRAIPWNAAQGRKGRTRTFHGPDALDRALAYIKAEEGRLDGIYREAGAPVSRNSRRVRFADYAARWAAGAGYERQTRRNYASHVRTLSKAWAGLHLDEIDAFCIRAHLADVQAAGRGPATRAARLTVLRGIFREALREGLIERDPVAGIQQGKMRRTPNERAIPEETVLRVQEHCVEWLRAAVILSYDSGLRVGEICGLTWEAVDLDARTVLVRDVVLRDGSSKPYPKGGEVLAVPLSERTVEALREHAERFPGRPTDRVFRRWQYAGNRPLLDAPLVEVHPDRVKRNWQRGLDRAGVTGTRPRWHDLRHGCARAFAASGLPAHIVQRLMRHASIASTQVYMPAVSAEEMRTAMDRARPGGHLRVVEGGAAPVGEPRSA